MKLLSRISETINGYRGSIGKLVFKKYKGRTIVGRKVKSSKPPTEGQLAQRAKFREASDFAKTLKADAALLAFYEPIAKQREVTVNLSTRMASTLAGIVIIFINL